MCKSWEDMSKCTCCVENLEPETSHCCEYNEGGFANDRNLTVVCPIIVLAVDMCNVSSPDTEKNIYIY